MRLVYAATLICLILALSGCVQQGGGEATTSTTVAKPVGDTDVKTFRKTNDDICTTDGKPVIRLYSTTGCPHCVWIKETYDSVAKEYADAGKIVAHHWELDTNDDTLSKEAEGSIPPEEFVLYQKYNPSGGVPTFVFGCRYVRVGNAYERANNLTAEEQEFRNVIEALVRETGGRR